MERLSLKEGPLAPVFTKLAGWGAGPNPSANTPDEAGRVAGFWLGFWHGMTAPIALVVSLFNDKVHVYEVHNNGRPYVIGFILGVTAIWGGGGRASSSRRRPSV